MNLLMVDCSPFSYAKDTVVYKCPCYRRSQSPYYLYNKGKLEVSVLTHLDNLALVGAKNFMEDIISAFEKKMNVSMVETGSF